MKILYKSLVRSHLEYACPLWAGLSVGETQKLEAIQRSFTNKITCPPGVDDYWKRLEHLNLMSLQRRRERYVILHMGKILHKRVSNDIGIRFQESFRFGTVAAIPPLHRTSSQSAKSLYDSSFAVKGPALWNIIPKQFKSHETLNTEQF